MIFDLRFVGIFHRQSYMASTPYVLPSMYIGLHTFYKNTHRSLQVAQLKQQKQTSRYSWFQIIPKQKALQIDRFCPVFHKAKPEAAQQAVEKRNAHFPFKVGRSWFDWVVAQNVGIHFLHDQQINVSCVQEIEQFIVFKNKLTM